MSESSNLLSFGLIAGRPVFMDERQDSYFVLDETAEAEFLDVIDRNGRITAACSADLRSALESPGAPLRTLLAQPPQADRSLLDEIAPQSRPGIGDTLRVARLMRRARAAIVARPLGEIFFHLARGAGADRQQPHDKIVADVARFTAARRLVPYRPNCLTDSLALIEWLGSRHLLLIFGAKLEPFAAHCWVQLGELVINDRTEIVRQFRPVRVIEC